MPYVRNNTTGEVRSVYEGQYMAGGMWTTDDGQAFIGLVPGSSSRTPPTKAEKRAGIVIGMIALLIILSIPVFLILCIVIGAQPWREFQGPRSVQVSAVHHARHVK